MCRCLTVESVEESKAGLVNHRRRIHEESAAKKRFECEKCRQSFKKESELKNHGKVCGGAVASTVGRVMCVCGKEYSKSYFWKHRRECVMWQNQNQQPAAAAVHSGSRGGLRVVGPYSLGWPIHHGVLFYYVIAASHTN